MAPLSDIEVTLTGMESAKIAGGAAAFARARAIVKTNTDTNGSFFLPAGKGAYDIYFHA
jgi:hypothetical protein